MRLIDGAPAKQGRIGADCLGESASSRLSGCIVHMHMHMQMHQRAWLPGNEDEVRFPRAWLAGCEYPSVNDGIK
jgi:hypothetical protein